MPVKREADPSFIKPDPGKRIKREGGDGNFGLSSIPLAPTHAHTASGISSAAAPKFEGGDRKPLAPAPNFGGSHPMNVRKRKFGGNSIKARRDDDLVSAHFDRKTMSVEFDVTFRPGKKWCSVEVEQEIFDRLNKAKFDIQPVEDWGFLDRNLLVRSPSINYRCRVKVYSTSEEKVENLPPVVKKQERSTQPKNESF
ncbi:hypothetical protein KVR01_006648 [Diaporthe batatas]|uniref:uncharacterized protein n=1 Tax=Diaporthe batatas TaxID=748121 RepID=UPI001D0466AF|nr:uncharacterized protein KVR01_006648 [Diaporthe batatas]KAG8163351.1 hypothetical protein KVR01_006648 [Diaporthe batatas]